MLPPGTIFKLKIHQNVYAAGASPRTTLGQITELPRPLAGCKRAASRQGRGRGRVDKEEKEEKDRGIAFPTPFLQFNHCSAVYSCCDLYTVARLSSSACV